MIQPEFFLQTIPKYHSHWTRWGCRIS